MPSQDTILRTLALIQPAAFGALLGRWARTFSGAEALESAQIALDGKSKRGTARRSDEGMPVHAVAAVLAGTRIALAEVAVDSKQNEISAAPDLLRTLELRGALVSGDAAYAQTSLAEQIVNAGGDYFLQIKGNQPTLQQELRDFFLNALDRPAPMEPAPACPSLDVYIEDVDKAHGRLEQGITVVAAVDRTRITTTGRWKALTTLVLVLRWRHTLSSSNTSNDASLDITSRTMDAAEAGAAARAHWEIEAFHHVLDVTFGEDACTIADHNTAQNLGVVRGVAQSILGQVEPKRTFPYKRRECAYNRAFRSRVLGRPSR